MDILQQARRIVQSKKQYEKRQARKQQKSLRIGTSLAQALVILRDRGSLADITGLTISDYGAVSDGWYVEIVVAMTNQSCDMSLLFDEGGEMMTGTVLYGPTKRTK